MTTTRVMTVIALLLLFATHASAEEVFYLHTDALGSVVVVTDENANVVERREYEPYGLPITPIADGPGFTGHDMDGESGLVYMQQRYYDPLIGQFLSVDPMAVDTAAAWNFNRYHYAANNPFKYTDPNGLDPYLVSRPLNLPVDANHNFIAINADFPGDPKATIFSYGDQGNDTMGPVDATTKGFSEGTSETDRAAWESLSKNDSTATFREIDATDEVVGSLASSMVAGEEYTAAPIFKGVNSNSAAGAIAQKADGGPSRVDNQRRQPGSGKSAVKRVKFKDEL